MNILFWNFYVLYFYISKQDKGLFSSYLYRLVFDKMLTSFNMIIFLKI